MAIRGGDDGAVGVIGVGFETLALAPHDLRQDLAGRFHDAVGLESVAPERRSGFANREPVTLPASAGAVLLYLYMLLSIYYALPLPVLCCCTSSFRLMP